MPLDLEGGGGGQNWTQHSNCGLPSNQVEGHYNFPRSAGRDLLNVAY